MQWRIGIANNGEIATGSGPLRAPVIAREVPTVGLDEAMLRLSRVVPSLQHRSWLRPARPLQLARLTTSWSRLLHLRQLPTAALLAPTSNPIATGVPNTTAAALAPTADTVPVGLAVVSWTVELGVVSWPVRGCFSVGGV